MTNLSNIQGNQASLLTQSISLTPKKGANRREKVFIHAMRNISAVIFKIALGPISLFPNGVSEAYELGALAIFWLPFGVVFGFAGSVTKATQKIFESLWGKPLALKDDFEVWIKSSEKTWNMNEKKGWLDPQTVHLFKQWRTTFNAVKQEYLSQRQQLLKEMDLELIQLKNKDKSAEAEQLAKMNQLKADFKAGKMTAAQYNSERYALHSQTKTVHAEAKVDFIRKIESNFQKQEECKHFFEEKLQDCANNYYTHRKEKLLEEKYKKDGKKAKPAEPRVSFEEFKKKEKDEIAKQYQVYLKEVSKGLKILKIEEFEHAYDMHGKSMKVLLTHANNETFSSYQLFGVLQKSEFKRLLFSNPANLKKEYMDAVQTLWPMSLTEHLKMHSGCLC